MKRLKNPGWTLVFLLAILCMVASCIAPQTTTPPTEVKNPNTYIAASIQTVNSLDPAWAYDSASGEKILNIYETLIFY
ncbi:MAG: ABC transporter substrate-binding protein, partial [Dehalococcoidia bacterium]